MKRLFLFLSLIISLTGFAGRLSPQQALQRARDTQHARALLPSSPMRLHTTVNSSDMLPAVYVLTSSGSTLILSADDLTEAVIGYTDQPIGDNESLPDNMQAWLNDYAAQIAYLRVHPSTPVRKAAKAPADRSAIGILCATRWNQDEPYNFMCPWNSADNRYTYTGCMATALAQLMKYHNWPDKGEGSNTYSTSTIGGTLSCNFSSITFDWKNMLNDYSDGYLDEEAKAVAQLMSACGIAMNMDYGRDGSGATIVSYLPALVKYFKYDQSVRYCMRDFYTQDQWETMIYENLRDVGPLHMGGGNLTSGHAFLCDGYDGNGYFHINWGWGGACDGYFLLSVLDPNGTGIGASEAGGFIYNQDAILNFFPAKSGSKVYPNIMADDFLISDESATEWVYIDGPVISYAPVDISVEFGVKVVNTSTGAVYHRGECPLNDIPPFAGAVRVFSYLPTVPDGDYVLTPAIYYDGEWIDCPVKNDKLGYVEAQVKNNVYYFDLVASKYPMVTSIEVPDPAYLDSKNEISVNVSNPNASYVGPMVLELSKDGEMLGYFDERTVYCYNDYTHTEHFELTLPSDKYAPGTYNLRACVVNGSKKSAISGYYPITFASNDQRVYPDLFSSMGCRDGGVVKTDNPEVVYSGYIGSPDTYSGNLYLCLYKYDNGWVEVARNSVWLELKGWVSQMIDIGCVLPSPIAGERYAASLWQDKGGGKQRQIDEMLELTIEEAMGDLSINDLSYQSEVLISDPRVSISFNVKAENYRYKGQLRCLFAKYRGWDFEEGIFEKYIDLDLAANEQKTINWDFEIPNPETDDVVYMLQLFQCTTDDEFDRYLDGGNIYVVQKILLGDLWVDNIKYLKEPHICNPSIQMRLDIAAENHGYDDKLYYTISLYNGGDYVKDVVTGSQDVEINRSTRKYVYLNFTVPDPQKRESDREMIYVYSISQRDNDGNLREIARDDFWFIDENRSFVSVLDAECPESVNANDPYFEMKFNAYSEFIEYHNSIYYYIYYLTGDNEQEVYSDSQRLDITIDERYPQTWTARWPMIDTNATRCRLKIMQIGTSGEKAEIYNRDFDLVKGSGIDDVTADDQEVRIFTLSGLEVKPDNLAPGFYILVSREGSRKIYVK